jgi:predicted DNA-binding protein (UPF0251 family)
MKTHDNEFVNTSIGLLDKSTGEIIELDDSNKPVKLLGREPAWFKGFKKGFRSLARLKMGNAELQVLFEIMGRLKYGNHISINQTEWAKNLKISRETISRALSALEKRSIITKQQRNAQSNDYRLNPAYCWCGAAAKVKP